MENRIKRLGKCVFLTLGVLGTASLAGCSQEVSALFGSVGTQVEVIPSFSERGQVMTRGGDNLDNGTNGFGNTSAGVCVKVDQNNSVYSPYQYSIASGGKAVTPPASAPTFPSNVTSVNVYGWYPYNNGNTSFTIQSNQQSDANYCLSDLMLANKAVCTRNLTTGAVTAASLSFHHVMAKVKVVLTPQSGITVSAVKLKNVKPTVNINESDVTALTVDAASGDVTDVTLLSGGSITSSSTAAQRTLCGVFPEQTFTSAFLVVTAKTSTGSNTDITYSFTGAGKTFEKNNEYVVNLTISPQSLEENAVSLEEWQSAGNNPVIIGGSGGDLTIDPISDVTYNGSAHTPSLVVNSGTTTLTKDAANGYTCQWFNNTNAGTAVVLVLGQGTYADRVGVAKFTINPKALTDDMVAAISAQTYTRSQLTPAVTVTDGSALTLNTDYTVGYGENINVSTGGSATVTGTGNYTGSVTKNFTISPKNISGMTLTLSQSATTYTGSAITASVSSLMDGTFTLSSSTDYTVASGSVTSATNAAANASAAVTNNTITVNGTGNYTGSVSKTWSIARATPSLTISSYSPNPMNLTSSSATGTITVSRDGDGAITASSSATGVATTSVSGNTVTVTAIADGSATVTVKMNQGTNYTAYTASDKTVSVSASGFERQVCDLSAATSSHIGYIICSNSHVHTSANPNCGGTASVMIAYIGTENNAAGTGNYSSYYKKGLAIALTDVKNTSGDEGSGTMSLSDASTACSAYKRARPSASSAWFLPSAYQWERMLIACGSTATFISSDKNFSTSSNSFPYGDFRTKLTALGSSYNVLSSFYWSSTEYSSGASFAWYYDFYGSRFFSGIKTGSLYVRAVFAF